MNRPADFLRTQVQGQGGAVETRTTVTRQQVMGQSGSSGGVLLRQEHLQTTSSQPVTPSATPPPRHEEPFLMSEQVHDPPLFSNGARRLMETWPQRAPLLYGPHPASAGTDADSSGSIPRELVQAEVRRQVTEALEAQRKMMQELLEENSRLKAAAEQPNGATVASALESRGVPESNLVDVAQSRGVPGSNLDQVAQSRGVLGSNLDQVAQSCGVPGSNLDQVVHQSRGVPTGGLASVAQGHRGIGGGMEHTGFYFGAATDEEDGTYRGRLRSGRVNVDVHGPRGASVDRRSSPLGRSIFRQPSPPGRGGSRSSGPRGQGFGFGDGKEPTPLDGDGYGLPAVERVYRQPNYQEAGTFGDYDVDPPPGLPQRERVDAPDTTVQAGALEPEAEEKAAGPKDPNPLEVLITGMTQLQQLLLKKGDGLDLETKGLQELPKLAEYCPETGAIDFQDYLYLVEQQIGSIASGAAEWWQKTLEVAQQAYTEYQSLSPVKRLGVKAQLTGELRSERYRRLEKKVAAMLLQSLPKGVRDDLVAYRVQGVHQILYRLMVIFQPGGAQDRAQLLRQLDVADSAPTAAEAVVSIRRWYRLLQRASDLGVQLPDESIQTRSLTTIVKRVSEQNSDFKFRLALARTELQVDTRPNQTSVLKYMQHLVAELEQLGSVSKKSSGSAPVSATTTATSPAPTSSTTPSNLKGLQGGDDLKCKGEGQGWCNQEAVQLVWFGQWVSER